MTYIIHFIPTILIYYFYIRIKLKWIHHLQLSLSSLFGKNIFLTFSKSLMDAFNLISQDIILNNFACFRVLDRSE